MVEAVQGVVEIQQERSEPGAIIISRPVFDQVKNKLTLGFDFVGEQAVKNVSEPVPSFRVVIDGSSTTTAPPDYSTNSVNGSGADP